MHFAKYAISSAFGKLFFSLKHRVKCCFIYRRFLRESKQVPAAMQCHVRGYIVPYGWQIPPYAITIVSRDALG